MDTEKGNGNIGGVKEFLEKLEENAEFRKRFEDFIVSAHRENSGDLLSEMLKFINNEGFTCSIQDLALLLQKSSELSSVELSDEDLKAVNGGGDLLNGLMGAFRNIFTSTIALSNAFNKMLMDLPKRLIDIFPK